MASNKRLLENEFHRISDYALVCKKYQSVNLGIDLELELPQSTFAVHGDGSEDD